MNVKRTFSLFAMLFFISILIFSNAAGAATSTRSLPDLVNVGSYFTVNVAVVDYGAFGGVEETIPAGFTYDGSTLDGSQVLENGSSVKFMLYGETNFEYTVTASSTEGTYTFTGIGKDDRGDEFSIGGDTSITLVAESAEQVNDPTPDEQTSTPEVQTKQIDSESVEAETIDENSDETDEIETSVDDVTDESSKSVKTTPSTESTEDIPATESTPFISIFGIIVIGVIATLAHKLKH